MRGSLMMPGDAWRSRVIVEVAGGCIAGWQFSLAGEVLQEFWGTLV